MQAYASSNQPEPREQIVLGRKLPTIGDFLQGCCGIARMDEVRRDVCQRMVLQLVSMVLDASLEATHTHTDASNDAELSEFGSIPFRH